MGGCVLAILDLYLLYQSQLHNRRTGDAGRMHKNQGAKRFGKHVISICREDLDNNDL
ncbi:MAG: hypothetical protein HMLIMOIP_000472 [Candidatus Nitrosomirales archaeon]|jgi:hypothetical protein